MTFRTTLSSIESAAVHLSDVHTADTLTALYAETGTTWHEGDVAVISGVGAAADIGTYVYRGTTSGQGRTGTTVANDWLLLNTPTDAVLSVAGETGAISKAELLLALNVANGADATPANGIYLATGSATEGQIPKWDDTANAWVLGDDNAGTVTGVTVALDKAIGSASVTDGKTEYAASDFGSLTEIAEHHRLTYNGLVLIEGTDYSKTSSAITLTSATELAIGDQTGTLVLENTTVTVSVSTA